MTILLILFFLFVLCSYQVLAIIGSSGTGFGNYTAGDGIVIDGDEIAATAGNQSAVAYNESLNYVWNSTDWVGALSTGEGILQIEVFDVYDSDTSFWTKTGSDLYYANQVGIGLTTPSSALDVSGGIELNGVVINDWSEINISTNAGNSNATLWIMFANISQIMNNITIGNLIGNHIFGGDGIVWNGSQITATATNDTNDMNNGTIYDMINAVSDNDTTIPAQSNATILHLINATRLNHTWYYNFFANLSNIMNNQTLYNMINSVSDNDTDTNTWKYQNNLTLSNFIAGYIFTGDGIVWNGSQMFATSTNGTTYYLMNNQTIYNMINAVSDNDTDTNTWNSNESISQFINSSVLGTFNDSIRNTIPNNTTINDTAKSALSAGSGIVVSGGTITSTATNTTETYEQDYMIIDITGSKYNNINWNITDAEANNITISATNSTVSIFGREIA